MSPLRAASIVFSADRPYRRADTTRSAGGAAAPIPDPVPTTVVTPGNTATTPIVPVPGPEPGTLLVGVPGEVRMQFSKDFHSLG